MFQAGSVITKVGADLDPLKSAFAGARREATGFAGAMDRTLGGVGQAFAGVARQAAMMGTAIAGAGVAAAAGLGVWAIKLAADAEQARVSFSTMLGSVEKAKALMAEINSFAAATPFQTTELVAASKSLLAFGVAQQQIIPTMRTLGDLAAGLNIPLNDLAQIYGKARVAGRLMAEDVNQLVGRGIPVIQEFAKQFGVAESEVRGLVESGQIGFPNLQRALVSLTSDGGKFTGMMEAQSQTVAGLWSTLKDSIELNLTRLGEIITEKLDLRGVINGVSEAIGAMATVVMPMINSMAGGLGEVGKSGMLAANGILSVAETVATGLAYAARVLDWLKMGFKIAQIGASTLVELMAHSVLAVSEAIAWVVNKAIDGINLLIQQLNKIPKVNISEIGVELVVDRSKGDAIIEAQKAYRAQLGSEIVDLYEMDRVEKVGAFFDQVRAKAREAADAAAAVGSETKQVAIEIEKGMKTVEAVKKVKADAKGPAVKVEKPVEQETRLASFMRAGSAQAVQFAFQQKQTMQDQTAKKHLAVSEAGNEVLKQIRDNLAYEMVTV